MPAIIISSVSVIAILLYLLTASWLGIRMLRLRPAVESLNLSISGFAALALSSHALLLYQGILTEEGFNLGFYHALSLMSWLVALLVMLASSFRPMSNLIIIFFPFAAFALLLEVALPSTNIISGAAPAGLKIHILLSVAAYGLLAIAAVQSLVLAFQETQLRKKQPVKVLNILPPMQTLEKLLVQALTIGFFLLSLSLATGLMFVHDILEQRLSHKVVLSILAWLIFAVVLWGRWARGWRGKKLIRWTLGGFISLLLAYFGSKLVLELILHRV